MDCSLHLHCELTLESKYVKSRVARAQLNARSARATKQAFLPDKAGTFCVLPGWKEFTQLHRRTSPLWRILAAQTGANAPSEFQ
jgi:hypothetical protein